MGCGRRSDYGIFGNRRNKEQGIQECRRVFQGTEQTEEQAILECSLIELVKLFPICRARREQLERQRQEYIKLIVAE